MRIEIRTLAMRALIAVLAREFVSPKNVASGTRHLGRSGEDRGDVQVPATRSPATA